MISAVAHRYARALVDIVLAPGSPLKPEDAIAQLRATEQTIDQSAELHNALLTPAIQSSRKRAVMAKLIGELGASNLIRNFVFVLIDRRRIGIFADIREAFEELLDERMGFVRAEVSSATALDDRRSETLQAELAVLTGKRMRIRYAVNPELLGGVVARIGSTVYDGSLYGQLLQLRRQLTEQSAE